MAAFRRLVCAALCAGLLSGALAAAAHQLTTVPLILEAESYERAAQPARATEAPESGIERAAATLVADLLTGIGFALLVAAGFALRGGPVTWRDGLLWGLAGFVAFSLAPGIGLPPELPGAAAAPLAARQLWWLATALSTAFALALLAFTRRPFYAVLAVILLVLPQAYGAPPAAAPAAAPEALGHRFAIVATLVSFLFWAGLGAATGYFYRRFAPPAA